MLLQVRCPVRADVVPEKPKDLFDRGDLFPGIQNGTEANCLILVWLQGLVVTRVFEPIALPSLVVLPSWSAPSRLAVPNLIHWLSSLLSAYSRPLGSMLGKGIACGPKSSQATFRGQNFPNTDC